VKVTIVHDSDRNAIVHRAGCADITRRDTKRRSYLSHYDTEVTSERAAALDAWSDFLRESMTEDQAVSYTSFMPCTNGLPETDPAKPLPQHNRPDGHWCRWSGVDSNNPDGLCPDRCQEDSTETEPTR
jgi:hypothetical protein